ncbi:MAG: SMP-30/gluconolactonase/LRE family protein [Acidiferrobacterales bacterium]|nr:SMP-30/gluconolactonase/LRE family protein [Acidiferrobacterales bacterium]
MHHKSALTLLAIATLLLSSCANHQTTTTALKTNNPLNGMGDIEVVASGFISTEGPVWQPSTNSILFSDIPGNTIYQLEIDSNQLSKVRTPSSTANGLALDNEGFLLAAEQQSRTITRMNLATGEVSPFISMFNFEGQQLAFNSPNDMAIHANGNVYFTDPPFGLRGRESDLNFNGVFLRPPDGTIELLKRLETGDNPNGIIFNPDQSTLYLAISHDESAPILTYDVDAIGNLSNEKEFATGQNNDGMAVDTQGNLYVANRTGVRVWSETGEYWGMISLPDEIRTTNVAFGGENMDTLFITNRSPDLYAVKLNVVGHQ